jgi:hypothetical protein
MRRPVRHPAVLALAVLGCAAGCGSGTGTSRDTDAAAPKDAFADVAVDAPAGLAADVQPEAATDAGPAPLVTGPFLVTVDAASGSVSVALRAEPARALWQSAAGRPFVAVRAGHAAFAQSHGSVTVTDAPYLDCPVATIREVASDAGAVRVRGDLDAADGGTPCALGFEAVFQPVTDVVLGVDVTVVARAGGALPPAADLRVVLSCASDADERFRGFGVQYSYLDLKGRVVPIVVQEQGIGRGLEPVSDLMNALGYFPQGTWVGIWDGAEIAGSATHAVPAPIGRPAVFFRKGSAEGAGLVAALAEAGLLAP